jgi:hypothetical protein
LAYGSEGWEGANIFSILRKGLMVERKERSHSKRGSKRKLRKSNFSSTISLVIANPLCRELQIPLMRADSS